MDDIKHRIAELYRLWKIGCAFDNEYTEEIYDFMLESGMIALSELDKKELYEKAYVFYQNELRERYTNGTYHEAKKADGLLKLLRSGQLTSGQTAYIQGVVYRFAITNYFERIKKRGEQL